MEMRRSKTLELLRAEKPVFTFKVNTSDPRIVELAAIMGIPCIWADVEHVANDWHVIESQVMAAKAHDADILCRVARGPYSDYIRPFELDAAGIMVPHIMSPEDAENVVRMTKFYPIGRRPVDGGNADALYCTIPQAEYNRQANEQRFTVLQIEDPEAMERIDEIAAVPGYDMLFFGPGDYSHAIGHSGEFDHPDIVEGFRKVAETAHKYGKYAGTVGGVGNAKERIDQGYNLLNLGADVAFLNQSLASLGSFIKNFN